ncbi:hypothetical protein D3C78_1076300 [compost metagenome]
MWQKGILLAFIETMNFINKEDSATTCVAILPGTFDGLTDLLHPRGDGRQPFDISIGIASNHFCQRGLAGAWRPP